MVQAQRFTAISKEKFSDKAWQRYTDYAFAACLTTVPLVAAELVKVVPAMPLGFVQMCEGFQLVAITGLQPGTNLFVAPDGRWLGDYVPATLRGYPFLLIKPQDGADSVLCINEGSGLVVKSGYGEAFFDQDGQPSKAVMDILDFLLQIERTRTTTQAAVGTLAAANLIQPWLLSFQEGVQNVPVTGLYRIDEVALNALDNEAFLALRGAGALPVAYAQLLSMNQIDTLHRLARIQAELKASVPEITLG